MFDRSLMERLEDGAATRRVSFDRFRASVLENLRRVLNSRQGCCETRPDLGMPDLNEAVGQGADAVRALAHSLKQQIETFEPRLRNVSIRFHADPENPLQLSFHVNATVDYKAQMEPISFDAIFERHVRVRG
ncbi:type VI secretion system baseplate subunit TssE [Bradyrhizobium sp. Pear77]|uniref:type VI secretion system baseplate subunit TssE n=1 Tax=Bradyrhizobium TaxID=374 RepID=UPI001E41FE9C|nr:MULTISPECIES: type VI secretion system baseplate subunit TssE [Bradyrhizobium]MCC8955323.1 type VI secretion system baseplate subunit TssE [Bradyrhizobium altum]MCC8965048.1 type VI secretion system baseplate subunit TssE [Bradyrhizobium oropedii]